MEIKKLTKIALLASTLLALPALAEEAKQEKCLTPWQIRETIYKDVLASDTPSETYKKYYLLEHLINTYTSAYVKALAKINTGNNQGYKDLNYILMHQLQLQYDLGDKIIADIKK